jgi:hypothetical protein
MVWQAEAGMWFRMPGGYFVGPDPNGGALRDAPSTPTSPSPYPAEWAPPDLTPALRRQIVGDLAR